MKITVSVEARIVNPSVFPEILVRLSLNFNAYTFGHRVIVSGKNITAPPPTPPKKTQSECARKLIGKLADQKEILGKHTTGRSTHK